MVKFSVLIGGSCQLTAVDRLMKSKMDPPILKKGDCDGNILNAALQPQKTCVLHSGEVHRY